MSGTVAAPMASGGAAQLLADGVRAQCAADPEIRRLARELVRRLDLEGIIREYLHELDEGGGLDIEASSFPMSGCIALDIADTLIEAAGLTREEGNSEPS